MAFDISQWRSMPLTAATGISLWMISWLWFVFYIYFLTQDSNWALKLAIALILLAIFIVRASNWARIIALMSNAMAILFLIFLAFVLFKAEDMNNVLLVSGNFVVFCLSAYFLAIPSTADFFKKHSILVKDPQKGKVP